MVKRILSIVGWIGTALVFVAVAIRFGFPAKDQYGSYLAWAGLVCVLAYTLGQWREISAVFGGRQARYGTLAGVSLLVVLGILIAVNYIGARENKRWDLTSNKSYSLSDQTRNILSKLDSPMQVTVFAREQDFQPYMDRMKEYEYASKQISTQYIDPEKKPLVAKANQITQFGTVVFNYKNRSERVTSNSEQDITSGIIKAVTGQQKKVYFTQGHGEHDPVSAERDGYNQAAGALGRENYSTDKLVLVQRASVPDDAAVVVVAGPKIDFYPAEIDALKKYLAKGGKLLLELDPPEKVDSPPLPQLIALAKKQPGTISIALTGIGRLTHLTGELLQARADIKLLPVPYTRGPASALGDVATGRVSMIIEGYSGIIGAVKAGQVKLIAVASPQRLPEFPDLPTVAETIPGFAAAGWLILAAPVGTPEAIIGKASADLAKVVGDPEVKQKLAVTGSYPRAMTPSEALAFVAKEQATWLPVLEKFSAK